MKRIAVIAFAVALGLSWTGIAIPADVKEETKETLKDAGETTKEKLKDAGETTGEKAKDAGGDKDGMDSYGRSVKAPSRLSPTMGTTRVRSMA